MEYKTYYNIISKIKCPDKIFNFNKGGKLIICLIEFRLLKEIEFVINAILHIYDPQEIGLSIVYGNDNKNYIENLYKHFENIKLIHLNCPNITRYHYSALLKKPQFWENFNNWSHILIYQTDALILRKIDPIYFEYDYIGAPWQTIDNWIGTCVPKYNGGNGGFSLRNIKKMIQCCEIYRNVNVNNIPKTNEDGFFCQFDLKYIEPKSKLHTDFAMETLYSDNPIGVHQIYRYIDTIMNSEQKEHFINKLKTIY